MLDGLKTQWQASRMASENIARQVIAPEEVLSESQKKKAFKLSKIFTSIRRISFFVIESVLAISLAHFFWIFSIPVYGFFGDILIKYILWFLAIFYVIFKFRDYFFRGK